MHYVWSSLCAVKIVTSLILCLSFSVASLGLVLLCCFLALSFGPFCLSFPWRPSFPSLSCLCGCFWCGALLALCCPACVQCPLCLWVLPHPPQCAGPMSPPGSKIQCFLICFSLLWGSDRQLCPHERPTQNSSNPQLPVWGYYSMITRVQHTTVHSRNPCGGKML